jgi:hypothetical protein
MSSAAASNRAISSSEKTSFTWSLISGVISTCRQDSPLGGAGSAPAVRQGVLEALYEGVQGRGGGRGRAGVEDLVLQDVFVVEEVGLHAPLLHGPALGDPVPHDLFPAAVGEHPGNGQEGGR